MVHRRHSAFHTYRGSVALSLFPTAEVMRANMIDMPIRHRAAITHARAWRRILMDNPFICRLLAHVLSPLSEEALEPPF